ncbi:hypothetical protein I552_2331 [Mycobacterium xenopi 3993]|nr:hypothetical protein I552_2331 [Mycobacterium xenopi 3993]
MVLICRVRLAGLMPWIRAAASLLRINDVRYLHALTRGGRVS